MSMSYRQRTSESSYINAVWQAKCTGDGKYIAPALGSLELLVTRHTNRSYISLWGASACAISIDCPIDADILGIRLQRGITIPALATQKLVNRHVLLPTVKADYFELDGNWQFPDEEDVELFIERLFKRGHLAYDPVVKNVLEGHPVHLSTRSIQRRFQKTIGISRRTLYQIERAHRAAHLLANKHSILNVVHALDYFDQAHLTRCLTHFIGYTPGQITSRDAMA